MLPQEIVLEVRCSEISFLNRSSAAVAKPLAEYCIQFLAVHI